MKIARTLKKKKLLYLHLTFNLTYELWRIFLFIEIFIHCSS